MTKLLNLLIVLLTAALLFVIIYPQVQQNRPVEVRILCDSSAASLPLLLAFDDSLFIKNKVNPKLLFYSDPDQALADLFAGKADLGVFPWSTILRRATEKQETLKVFLSEEYRQSLPVDAIVTKIKSPVRSMTDLRGRRLAYPPQIRDYLPLFLMNLGISDKDIKLVETPLSGLVDALTSGAADAAWVIEPQLCALDSTQFRTVQPSALARYVSQPFPGAAVGASPALLKSHRLAGGRLKVATDAAVALAEGKADKARAVLGRYFEYCKTSCGSCRLPEFQRLSEVNKGAVTALVARLKLAGVLKSDIDLKGVFVDPATLKR